MKKITKIIIGIVVILLVIGVFFFYKFKSPEPYTPTTNLLNTIPVPASGICSDGLCRQIYGDGISIIPVKKVVKYEKQYFTTNPFGTTLTFNNGEKFIELGADLRVHYWHKLLKMSIIPEFDKSILKNSGDTVFTFDLVTPLEEGYSTWCFIKENEISEWSSMISKIVERYDGDANYGCSINNGVDCYSQNDMLYPSSSVRARINSNPIKYWQIGNEHLAFKNCESTPRKITLEEFIEVYEIAYSLIKNADSTAKIIAPAISAPDMRIFDGYYDNPAIVNWEIDCKYKETNVETLFSNKGDKETSWAYDFITRFLLTEKDKYDIVDFHSYLTDIYERPYFLQWVNDYLQYSGIAGKKIWSTENAAPYYYFPLMGLQKPSCSQAPSAGEGRDFKQPYDKVIHSEYIVKNVIIQLPKGLEKMYYFSLISITWETDNTARFGLIEVDNVPKPAYYTYKLMIQKLKTMKSLEKIDDYIYKAELDDGKIVVVAWSDAGKTINLLDIFSGDVKITHIITETGKTDLDALIETKSANSIPLTKTPIFIEAAK